ncbi:MAG: chemotaxis protein CheD [bacterium]
MNDLKQIFVYISDMKVSEDPGTVLVTHSLGSCIGLAGYDPVVKVGALLHFQLPDSRVHTMSTQENPHMFADTAIPLLLQQLYAHGAERDNLLFGMFGGASLADDTELLKIGIKNARATKKVLWQHSISITHEDVGGEANRTVRLEIASGKIGLKKDGRTYKL